MTEEVSKLRNLCHDFVKTKQGCWNHSDWIEFLAEIRAVGYHTLSDSGLGRELEGAKDEFWKNYRSLVRAFVNKNNGNWNHSDWADFVAEVRKAGYGSLTDVEVGRDLEKAKSEYWNDKKHRQSVEIPTTEEKVTIRIECGDSSVEETFLFDGTTLHGVARLQEIPLSLAVKDKALLEIASTVLPTRLTLSAIAASVIGISDFWATAHHAVQTITVVVNTPAGGAVLTMIAKQVYDQISAIVKKKFESRAKEIHIDILGPDGKPIRR